MKRTIQSMAILVLAAMTFLAACSKSSSPRPDDRPVPTTGTWEIAGQTYTKVQSTQDMQSPPGSGKDLVVIVITTSESANAHGAFSGSALTISFPAGLGAGSYKLVTSADVSITKASKVMNITCTLGTATTTGSTAYTTSSELNGNAQLTIDDKGKYHISLKDPVTLKKQIDVNGGIDGAKATYTLKFENLD